MYFQPPIGSVEERNSGKIWPGTWDDATGFLNAKAPKYGYGIHTGADLNWNSPRWDADKLSPVYAIGDGIVTYAQAWPNVKYWGNIIVINHGIVDGKPLFSRYAHVTNIMVSVNQRVRTGDQICQVGDGFTSLQGARHLFFYHLHFDISTTTKLGEEPNNWPAPASLAKTNKKKAIQLVMDDYVDPQLWLQQHHGRAVRNNVLTDKVITEVQPNPPAASTVWYVIASAGSWVHKDHSISAEQVELLPLGSTLSIGTEGGNQEGYTWARISGGKYDGCWLVICKEDRSETYVSTNPPH